MTSRSPVSAIGLALGLALAASSCGAEHPWPAPPAPPAGSALDPEVEEIARQRIQGLLDHPDDVQGRAELGMFYAAVVLRKSGTSFYFFPIYTHAQVLGPVSAELRKCQSGKSCFQIRRDDPVLYKQVRDLAKAGKALYKKIGWLCGPHAGGNTDANGATSVPPSTTATVFTSG